MANSKPMSFRFNRTDVAVIKWLAHHRKDSFAGVLRRGLRRELAAVDVRKMGRRGLQLRAAYVEGEDVATDETTDNTEEGSGNGEG